MGTGFAWPRAVLPPSADQGAPPVTALRASPSPGEAAEGAAPARAGEHCSCEATPSRICPPIRCARGATPEGRRPESCAASTDHRCMPGARPPTCGPLLHAGAGHWPCGDRTLPSLTGCGGRGPARGAPERRAGMPVDTREVALLRGADALVEEQRVRPMLPPAVRAAGRGPDLPGCIRPPARSERGEGRRAAPARRHRPGGNGGSVSPVMGPETCARREPCPR